MATVNPPCLRAREEQAQLFSKWRISKIKCEGKSLAAKAAAAKAKAAGKAAAKGAAAAAKGRSKGAGGGASAATDGG